MLVELAVVGGAAVAGVQALQRRHRKKTWGKRLVNGSSALSVRQNGTSITTSSVLSFVDDVEQAGRSFAQQHLKPLLLLVRNPDILISLFHSAEEKSEEEHAIDRQLLLAVGLVGLTGVGVFAHLPIALLASVPGLLYLQLPFIKKAGRELFVQHRFGMYSLDTVICLGALTAGFIPSLSLFYCIILLSEKVVIRTRDQSRQGLINIFGETPPVVWIKQGEVEVQIPFEQLQIGDMLVVHAGEQIPVDGTIVSGMATIDQHMLTGESQPVEKGIGEDVFAATLVLAGTLGIETKRAGSDTVAAQISDVLLHTTHFTSSIELEGVNMANRGALPTLLLGAVSFPFLGPMTALTVMCGTPGYGMQVFGPLGVLSALRLAIDDRILVKDGRSLETMRDVDTIVFDKTGTLTQEQPHVGAVYAGDTATEQDVLRYAAAAEYKQTHPIAHAILHAAQQQHIEIPAIQDASYEIGYGLQVWVGDEKIRVGSERFMRQEQIAFPETIRTAQAYCQEHGYSLVYVARNDTMIGAIELHATLRPETETVVQALQQRGLEVCIISGDHEQPTRQLSQQLGIDTYFAEVLPEDKASLVESLQQQGRVVCFVGDGINDAVALKKANVSVSLRGATTVAQDAAQVVLMDGDLMQIIHLLELVDQLRTTLQSSMLVAIIPSLFTIAGAFFLHFTLTTATVVFFFQYMGGLTVTVLPMLQKKGLIETTQERKTPV